MTIRRGRVLIFGLVIVMFGCILGTARSYALALTANSGVWIGNVQSSTRRPRRDPLLLETSAPIIVKESSIPTCVASREYGKPPTYSIQSPSFPGMRQHRNVCLKQGEDRLETTTATSSDEVTEETTFIFRDVCALGHTPKDVTHLFTFSRSTNIGIQHVIYGHRCMTRLLDPIKHAKDVVLRRSSVFHAVLRPWIALLYDADVLDKAKVSETYFEDYSVSNLTTKKCFRLVVERHETWRWFDTVARAAEFKEIFSRHFPVKKTPSPTIHRKLVIMILRRDEDRHFEELKLQKFLREKFGAVTDVLLAQYDKPPLNKLTKDNDVDVPPYEEQVASFVRADVIIAAHGAVLSSIMAMRPGTAVIELFPHNFRYYMYEELSRLLGLHYFPFEGSTVVGECCSKRSLTTMITRENLNGDRKCKKCDIAWTESEMYYTVKNAMSSVWLGYARQRDIHEFDVRK